MQPLPFLLEVMPHLIQLQPPEWNDVRPMFRYYLSSAFCEPFKIVLNNQLVATGCSILHGDSVWFAHIITHPDFRNQGLGSAMTQFLMDRVNRDKYKTILLIATALGEVVYRKLGFQEDGVYGMFTRPTIPLEVKMNESIRPFEPKYLKDLLALDRSVYDENRTQTLLEHLPNALVFDEGNGLQGYYLSTFGEGHVIANTKEAGLALLQLRNQLRYKTVLPLANQTGVDFLLSTGHTQYRSALKMYIGDRRNWQPERIFSRVSGQIG